MYMVMDPILITRMELTFKRDMPGFDGARHFVVEPVGEGPEGVFGRLVCTDTVQMQAGGALNNLTLLVMSPWILWREYEVEIDEVIAENLGLSSSEDVMLLVIVHPQEPLTRSTANLYSPIVINRHTGFADQLVPLFSEREIGWSVRTPFPSEGDD